MNDRVEEARKWLQIALDGGLHHADLELAHLTFHDAGQEEVTLAHLKLYLESCVRVSRVRSAVNE